MGERVDLSPEDKEEVCGTIKGLHEVFKKHGDNAPGLLIKLADELGADLSGKANRDEEAFRALILFFEGLSCL